MTLPTDLPTDYTAGGPDHVPAHETVNTRVNAACTEINTLLAGQTVERLLATDQTFTANTTLATLLSFPIGANEKWRVTGLLLVDGAQAADLKTRLQATSATGATGYFALVNPPAGSNTSTTAASMNPSHTVAVAVSAGATPVAGLLGVGTVQAIAFTAYLATAGTGGAADLQAAQQTSDATTLTVRAGSWLTAKRLA